MLDANKYIDRLREIVKDTKTINAIGSVYILCRVQDLIRDYDRDFDKAMEEMEDEGTRRGRETAEYLKQLKSV